MPSSLATRVFWTVSCLVGGYGLLLGLLTNPWLQRQAFYAHVFHSAFYHDVNEPEQFGFAKHQVIPFNIRTSDGESLYAWHVLPLDVYAANQGAVQAEQRPHGPVEDVTQSVPWKLLTQDPETRVVINFHGTAGHIAQGWRTHTYHRLSTMPHTHVFTIDYRGFGHSTGSPTEEGLIADGTALVQLITSQAKIPPERIVVLGQSLGTAVASAVALRFADPSPGQALLPASTALQGVQPTLFSGVVLVEPFFSMPSLLLVYQIGGFLPLLLPLRPFPAAASYVTSQMRDKWLTAERLAAYMTAAGDHTPSSDTPGAHGMLHIVHALDDRDISFRQSELILKRIANISDPVEASSKAGKKFSVEDEEGRRPGLRVEILEHGGHNQVITYAPVALAVMRAFGD